MQKLLLPLFAITVLAGCATAVTSGSSVEAPTTIAATSGASGEPASCDYSDLSEPGTTKQVKRPNPTAPDTGTVDYLIDFNGKAVRVTLDREQAPCTVNSFVSLAKQGYFDNTSCHRLVDSSGLYALQCGDPTGTGRGGPGYSFFDELTGDESYPAGTVAMANAGEDSSGSQFFIVYADSQLSPHYTVFGRLDAAGIKTVADIAAAGQDGSYPDGSGKPNGPALIGSVKPA